MKKRIAFTFCIAVCTAISFFALQYFVKQTSLPTAAIGAIVLFVILVSLPILFYIVDRK